MVEVDGTFCASLVLGKGWIFWRACTRNNVVTSDGQSPHHIIYRIVSQLRHRDLGSRQNLHYDQSGWIKWGAIVIPYHSLPEIFEHEAQRAGCIRHRISSMKYYESIEWVVELDLSRNSDPVYIKSVLMTRTVKRKVDDHHPFQHCCYLTVDSTILVPSMITWCLLRQRCTYF